MPDPKSPLTPPADEKARPGARAPRRSPGPDKGGDKGSAAGPPEAATKGRPKPASAASPVAKGTSPARPGPPEGTARARLRHAFLRPGRGQAIVAVLLAVLGFAFTVQVGDHQRDDPYAGLREPQLVQVLDGLTGTAQRARREAERLRETRDDLQSQSRARQAALSEAQQRAQTLRVLAGLVPVHGPGLRITITETAGRVSVGSLLDTIQELRTVGAEAMEFNDRYRVGAQSSFDNAVGGIELEGELLEAPYVLEVIGDPDALKGGLTFHDGPIDTLETFDGARVSVEELERVEIESVREPERPENASPAGGQ